MKEYIVSIGGEMTGVHLAFFKRLGIVEENHISDTYFITFENGGSNMTLSISQNEYDRVRIDLRDDAIESIIGI